MLPDKIFIKLVLSISSMFFLRWRQRQLRLRQRAQKRCKMQKKIFYIIETASSFVIFGRIYHFQMVGQPAKLLLKINTKELQASVIGWILFGQVLQPKMSGS